MRSRSQSPTSSVWDYPRPPAIESTERHLQIMHRDEVIADTHRAIAILETGHPPSYYIHPADIRMELMEPAGRTTFCEWKGIAHYFHLVCDGETLSEIAWTYIDPNPDYEAIKNYLAFYPGRLDACLVNGEQARPEPRHFYGGWITSDIRGPFR